VEEKFLKIRSEFPRWIVADDDKLLDAARIYLDVKDRFKPGGLCLFAAEAFGCREDVAAAIAVEFYHASSLIHDDIIDNHEFRRNEPTALKKYGLTRALLAGDILISSAYGAIENKPKCISYLTQVMKDLAFGQINDSFIDRDVPTIEEYRRISWKKNSATRLALLLGTHETENPRFSWQIQEFGKALGIATQVSNDINDMIGTYRGGKSKRQIGEDVQNKKTNILLIIGLENGTTSIADIENKRPEDIAKTIIKERKNVYAAVQENFRQVARALQIAGSWNPAFRELAIQHWNRIPIGLRLANANESLTNTNSKAFGIGS